MGDTREKVTLNAHDIADATGLSLPVVYALMKSEGFPSIHINRRYIVPAEQFRAWLADHAGSEVRI